MRILCIDRSRVIMALEIFDGAQFATLSVLLRGETSTSDSGVRAGRWQAGHV